MSFSQPYNNKLKIAIDEGTQTSCMLVDNQLSGSKDLQVVSTLKIARSDHSEKQFVCSSKWTPKLTLESIQLSLASSEL